MQQVNIARRNDAVDRKKGGTAKVVSKNVLVVDDSIVMRSLLRTALVEEHFVVFSAKDALEAMICLDNNKDVDLVVTDFHMPGLDGAAFIERIRCHPVYSAVPVLVLTAGADDEDKRRSRVAGANGWIVKPFDPSKLAAAIHELTPRTGNIHPASAVYASHRAGSTLRVRYDQKSGLIYTMVDGPTDREGVEDYLYCLQTIMERARADWGRCWHLVDATRLAVQTNEALNALSGASMEMLSPGDRTAIVMQSAVAIRQMEDMPSQHLSRMFKTLDAANEWLSNG